MYYRHTNFCTVTALTFLSLAIASTGLAEEKIIQQEKISFEKCLNVIAISEDKLSVIPKIIDETDQKRVATFRLTDGTLTITCDGIEGNVIVSTNKN